jgi:putative transposase
MPSRSRSPRLPEGSDYGGPLAGHLVFVTRRRGELFKERQLAETCVAALQETSSRLAATLWAYCVMPDHVHVLVEVPGGVFLTEFARRFKQLAGFRLKQHIGDFAWQVSYYDHILRSDEAVLDVARYIWENPVEAKLVESYLDYEWAGPREIMALE